MDAVSNRIVQTGPALTVSPPPPPPLLPPFLPPHATCSALSGTFFASTSLF